MPRYPGKLFFIKELAVPPEPKATSFNSMIRNLNEI
jgi:hypothetical protein